MTESKPAIEPDWVDPDDSPEWTDEMFDAAELSIRGRVVRKASGVLTANGIRRLRPPLIEVGSESGPRALAGRVYAQAGDRRIMAANEKTGTKAGKAASKVLKSGSTGKDSKTAAGSALSQRPNKKK